MTNPKKDSVEEQYYLYERQRVHLSVFPSRDYILDIGGGGEGVVGQLKGQDVIAIDLHKSELEEAANNGLKIVMDARDLQFLDGTFSSATAFFSLMYIREAEDCQTVMAEVFRVLQPGGGIPDLGYSYLRSPGCAPAQLRHFAAYRVARP